ncbi:N-6 DNA Methylase [Armatimonadetes bacterium GBS]|jgi:hypothetical protein|nr:N-6 DNA Methylase [Armatimonadetes bacterium GBS]
MSKPFLSYLQQVEDALSSGDATEGALRPALKQLVESLAPDIIALNEPRRIECGAPDLAIQRTLQSVRATIGYIETKEVGAPLDTVENSEQLRRYRSALPNLILTNYLEFRWYVNGILRQQARLAMLSGNRLQPLPQGVEQTEALLKAFLGQAPEPIADADTLAHRMARYAHLIREMLIENLQSGTPSPLLEDLRAAFARTLMPTLDKPEHIPTFADMLAQTLAYGLFAARWYHPHDKPFQRVGAAHEIPRSNPLLRQLFDTLTGTALDNEPFVGFIDDLVYLLHIADMASIQRDFGRRMQREDPVVHFYETFLKAYDPRERELRGVYYTPEPVVGYIVRSVHSLLRSRFNLPEGLATLPKPDAPSPLYILDPACGTGSFLAEIVAFIRHTLESKGLGGLWNNETVHALIDRIFGFELQMAPYTIAHLKLSLLLRPDGQPPPEKRLGIYLINTLEKPLDQIVMEMGLWRVLSEEAVAANAIKRQTPILVVIGNPPYSVHSANRSEWIEDLVRDHYYPRDSLREQNPKLLLDDYVKFIRWAQWRLEQTGHGILAFITNHSYLDNPTFRRMRRALMEAFDELYILNLHGNVRRKEMAPDGSPDENVFDIQQGVAILLAVRLPESQHASEPDACKVYYADLWGKREEKYAFLNANDVNTTPWRTLQPQPDFYLFLPQDEPLRQQYEQGWKLTDIFHLHSTGIKTHRDHFVIDFDRDALHRRIAEFRDIQQFTDDKIRQRYNLSDTCDWKLSAKRKELADDPHWEQRLQRCLYRPFDVRYLYYSPAVVERPREEVMRHLLAGENLALMFMRQVVLANDYSHVGVTNLIADTRCFYSASGTMEMAPLYLYHRETLADGTTLMRKEPNLKAEYLRALAQQIGYEPSPEQVLAYLYAVLHSPTYRQRYASFLRQDFPRVPLPVSAEQFDALASLGQALIDLHLLRTPQLSQSHVCYPVSGSNRVEKGYPRYDAPIPHQHDGRVWINPKQYFEGVPGAVWNFTFGGYQVCQKWLKDRRERILSNAEIETYRQIIVALEETLRIMAQIDALFGEAQQNIV